MRKFPIFLLIWQCWTVSAAAQQPGAGTAMSADQLLSASLRQLAVVSLGAKVRQSGEILERQIVATGDYFQQVPNSGETRTRLQLDLQVGVLKTHLLEVNDGKFLWLQRAHENSDLTTLQRVDVAKVKREMQVAGPPAMIWVDAAVAGGLPAVMVGLLQEYEFSPPQEVPLREISAWKLKGTRKAKSDRGAMPTSVCVYLGRDDLFPYIIEHQHTDAGGDDVGNLRTEYYEVAFQAAIDPLVFVFRWQGNQFTDGTDRSIQRIQSWLQSTGVATPADQSDETVLSDRGGSRNSR